jgi:hypothetical protein
LKVVADAAQTRADGLLPALAPADELMVLMAGTLARREAAAARARALLDLVDFDVLAQALSRRALLGLVGTRLADLAPGRLPARFSDEVEAVVAWQRRRASVVIAITDRLLSVLESAGIEALPVKGPLLGQEVFGDAGLRVSQDIDLLVAVEELEEARRVLERIGYSLRGEHHSGLPRLHHVLLHASGGMPSVELHWRLHWYETGFSAGVIARSGPDEARGRRPTPADELAMLLLFFSRDGFVGLRYPADVAAWMDAFGAQLEPHALDPLILAHPELADALMAALFVLERLVGLPVEQLTSLPLLAGARPRLAARLTDPTFRGSVDQLSANMTLVDWLLTPRGGQRAFVRRHLAPGRRAVREMYGLPEDARLRLGAWQVLHPPKLLLRYAAGLYGLRRAS